MDLYVVIVAGGSGKRMGAEIPKQFLSLQEDQFLCTQLKDLNYSVMR